MNKFRTPSIFSGRNVCHKVSSLLMVNAEKWGAKLEKWRRCQLQMALLLRVASFVLPTFNVSKVVYHE